MIWNKSKSAAAPKPQDYDPTAPEHDRLVVDKLEQAAAQAPVHADFAAIAPAAGEPQTWRAPQGPGRLEAGRPAPAAAAQAAQTQSGSRTMTSNPTNGSQGTGAPPSGPFSHAPPEGHAKTMSAVLGEIVWLMSQSPMHKQFFISDLEWFVMTPVLLQQFRLFYAPDRPIGVVLWAYVNDEVAARLASGAARLRPQDWKSGDQLWVVEVIAPVGGADEMVKELKTNVFPTRTMKFVARGQGAGLEVRTL